jgi:DNA-binding NarL/FixJ family response regulator
MINLILPLIFGLFFMIDIYFDIGSGVPISHIWHEVLLCLLALGAIAWQISVIFKKNNFILSLNMELLETKKSYQEWKQKTHSSAQEIRASIDNQFGLWQLSNSEKDVALLLVKGFSMKEIAEIRQTQEKTVRQQATTIYRKSGLSGRQELAAFFLEDILSTPIEKA